MAYVDANISLNMISGMNFSGLKNSASLSGAPKWFEARYSNGSSDTFYGIGFTYNPFTYEPTGSGIVTAYSSNDYWNDMQIYVSGIRISASEIIKASWTKSIADDQT
ncbi:hypothetical protein AB4144_53240, partial [Rhizobiaceae sp. 2RAB30]